MAGDLPKDPAGAATAAAPISLLSRASAGWLAVILLIGGTLRGVRLSEPPGGFHVFNEGFYVDLARRAASAGALDWFLRPLDVNNPPLYTGVVSALYRLHLPQIEAARGVSVVAGLLAIVATFVLGRAVYDERTGLFAAALLSVMPGVVLVDHNAQVDSLFVALLMWSVALYVMSLRSRSLVTTGVAGALLGLSALTKQPAVFAFLGLAAWETWRAKDVRWLKSRHTWVYVVASVVAGLSWYLIRLAVDGRRFIGVYLGLAGSTGMSEQDTQFWRHLLVGELGWMVFPLTAIVGVAGVIYLVAKRKAGDKLVLCFLVVYTAYYIALHYHSYYLLPLAPFVALAVARVVSAPWRHTVSAGWRVGVVVVLVVLMTFGSVVMLATKKWGRWSPAKLESALDAAGPQARYYVSPEAAGFFGPALKLEDPERQYQQVSGAEFASIAETATAGALYFAGAVWDDKTQQFAEPTELANDEVMSPIVFGWQVDTIDLKGKNRTQVYSNPPWTVWYTGSPLRFGFGRLTRPCGWAVYDRDSFGP